MLETMVLICQTVTQNEHKLDYTNFMAVNVLTGEHFCILMRLFQVIIDRSENVIGKFQECFQ